MVLLSSSALLLYYYTFIVIIAAYGAHVHAAKLSERGCCCCCFCCCSLFSAFNWYIYKYHWASENRSSLARVCISARVQANSIMLHQGDSLHGGASSSAESGTFGATNTYNAEQQSIRADVSIRHTQSLPNDALCGNAVFGRHHHYRKGCMQAPSFSHFRCPFFHTHTHTHTDTQLHLIRRSSSSASIPDKHTLYSSPILLSLTLPPSYFSTTVSPTTGSLSLTRATVVLQSFSSRRNESPPPTDH